MPIDRFALYFSIASGVMIGAALIVPAFYRSSQPPLTIGHKPSSTIEQNVNEFFAKYDLNRDGVVDQQEYELVKAEYLSR